MGGTMILCECGELIKNNTFKEYIQTSMNPSTRTIGHTSCGMIFNFIDGKRQKKYSSKIELKILALRFTEKNGLDNELIGKFLIEVDRLKSIGKYSDYDILIMAFERLFNKK
ncbi:MAG: hypothetical protein C5S41_03395 [Candidatus Methanomarinus sp.]|nr:MAG: hypothetical protein C5S41_03395 [ANME-2 cluster archaeon]KAF5429116.1 hypothetical protein C5S42_02260 [ANME-2 cluster archaeon]